MTLDSAVPANYPSAYFRQGRAPLAGVGAPLTSEFLPRAVNHQQLVEESVALLAKLPNVLWTQHAGRAAQKTG